MPGYSQNVDGTVGCDTIINGVSGSLNPVLPWDGGPAVPKIITTRTAALLNVGRACQGGVGGYCAEGGYKQKPVTPGSDRPIVPGAVA